MTDANQVEAVEAETEENDATETAAELSAADKLAAIYEKKGRIVIPSGASIDAFQSFIQTFEESQIEDWTKDLDYDAPTLLFVQSDSDENRLAMLPNKEVALADPIVRQKAYEFFIGLAVRALKKADTAAAMFRTPAGFITGFDKDAYKFQVAHWLKYLASKKAILNPKKLALALSIETYAKGMYSKVPQTFWNDMLDKMIQAAEAAGYNASLLIHWKQTRVTAAMVVEEFDWASDEMDKVADNAAHNVPVEAPKEEPAPVAA